MYSHYKENNKIIKLVHSRVITSLYTYIWYLHIYSHLNIKKFCITYNGPFLWNLLENKFKLFNNINTFTRRLKYNYILMYINAEYNLFFLYFILYLTYIFYIFSNYIYFLIF